MNLLVLTIIGIGLALGVTSHDDKCTSEAGLEYTSNKNCANGKEGDISKGLTGNEKPSLRPGKDLKDVGVKSHNHSVREIKKAREDFRSLNRKQIQNGTDKDEDDYEYDEEEDA